jgi:tRNA-dihydrouridine synthase
VVQLGGDNPDDLVHAALKCQALGASEINLNIGCPAVTAQSGVFNPYLILPVSFSPILSFLFPFLA